MKKIYTLVLSLIIVCSMQAKNFYVSVNGDDSNSGSKSKPWRTPELSVKRALDYMRDNPNKSVQLIVCEGEYFIKQSITINGADINAPFTIMAESGKDVTFRADVDLNDWQKCNDAELRKLLGDDVADNVYQIDMKSLGITDFGEPNGTTNRVDLYCDGQRQILARWPNEGFTKAGSAMGVQPNKYQWLVADVKTSADGVMEYVDSRIDRWAEESEPCVFGYWHYDWSEGHHAIECIDAVSRQFFIRPPYHNYGYRSGCRFYGYNLLCELDVEGEYYINRKNGILYWYVPNLVDMSKSVITLSVSAPQYMFKVCDMDDFTLSGIDMQGSRGGGVEVLNSNRCLIYDCTIRQFAQRAIHIEGGVGNWVDNCTLENLGHDGIHLIGGNRKTLEPCNHKVTNSVVRNFSLYKRTYQPAIYTEGVGFLISNNLFTESSSSAMRIEANDCLIEYNQIFHVVTESDDQGGLDMFFNYALRGNVIRYNHWRDIRGATHYGSAGVRFDDIISGQVVYGNVFENIGGGHFGGVQIHGGKDNLIENNLFYNCSKAASFSQWSALSWDTKFNEPRHIKQVYENADIRSDVYLNRYPKLREPYASNLNRNVLRSNLLVKCLEMTSGDSGQNVIENNTMLSEEDSSHPISYYLQSDVLKQYGLAPIPFDKIGPHQNPDIKVNRKKR